MGVALDSKRAAARQVPRDIEALPFMTACEVWGYSCNRTSAAISAARRISIQSHQRLFLLNGLSSPSPENTYATDAVPTRLSGISRLPRQAEHVSIPSSHAEGQPVQIDLTPAQAAYLTRSAPDDGITSVSPRRPAAHTADNESG